MLVARDKLQGVFSTPLIGSHLQNQILDVGFGWVLSVTGGTQLLFDVGRDYGFTDLTMSDITDLSLKAM